MLVDRVLSNYLIHNLSDDQPKLLRNDEVSASAIPLFLSDRSPEEQTLVRKIAICTQQKKDTSSTSDTNSSSSEGESSSDVSSPAVMITPGVESNPPDVALFVGGNTDENNAEVVHSFRALSASSSFLLTDLNTPGQENMGVTLSSSGVSADLAEYDDAHTPISSSSSSSSSSSGAGREYIVSPHENSGESLHERILSSSVECSAPKKLRIYSNEEIALLLVEPLPNSDWMIKESDGSALEDVFLDDFYPLLDGFYPLLSNENAPAKVCNISMEYTIDGIHEDDIPSIFSGCGPSNNVFESVRQVLFVLLVASLFSTVCINLVL